MVQWAFFTTYYYLAHFFLFCGQGQTNRNPYTYTEWMRETMTSQMLLLWQWQFKYTLTFHTFHLAVNIAIHCLFVFGVCERGSADTYMRIFCFQHKYHCGLLEFCWHFSLFPVSFLSWKYLIYFNQWRSQRSFSKFCIESIQLKISKNII